MTEQAFYNQVLNGTAMKRLISRLIAHFGMGYTSHILDQVKTLGFHQATATSISLGIDDLLTISSKRWLVQDAEEQNSILEKQNNYGNIHAVEKLRQSIEIWHATSEYLRHEMNTHFQMTDPYNPVYLMSFSGARGNASQIHQLVGMRGLMSDPQGQMIDLPIQSNLREGLSLTEYIISCYGARKGVIDTAIRTGDAGYLTRRLVEVVQHIIVRRKDCGTFQGISVSPQNGMTETIFVQTLTGRVLADDIYIGARCIATRNQNIGIGLINQIITFRVQPIYIRSPFTCRSTSWICQLCYGRSPSHGDLVELGEAVGIIAGQSIGEPGTQLTLRTFHTGGVFTGGTAEHIRAPFQGIIKFNEDLVHPTRTRYGHPAFLCSIDFDVTIESRNIIHNLTIPSKSLILVQNNQYIQSEQVIAEISNGTSPFAFKETVEKHIFSESGGEMHWSTYVYHAPKHEDSNVYLLLKTSHLWILAGSPYGSSQVSFSLYKDQDQMNVDSFSIKGRDISDELLNTSATKDRKIHDYSRPTQIISNDRSNFIYPSVLEENSYLLAKKRRNRFIIPLKLKYKKKKYKKKKDKKLIPCFAIWREIPIRGILNKDSILAYFDDPRYRRRMSSSGMIEWGTIEIEDLIKDQGTEEFLEDHTLIEDQGTEEFLEDHILIEDQGTEGFLEDHILIEDQRTKEFLEDHILIEDQRTEEFLEDHMLVEDQRTEEFLEDHMLVEDQGSEESPEDHTLIEDLEIPQHLTLIEYKGIKKSSRQYKRLVKYQKYQSLIEYQKTKELYPQYQPLIEDPETEETEEEFLERLEKGLLNESEEEFLEEIEKEFLEETEEESLEEIEKEFLEEPEEESLEEAEEEFLEEPEEESLEEAEEESLEEAEEESLEEPEEESLEEAEEEFLEEPEEEFLEEAEEEFLEEAEEEFLEEPEEEFIKKIEKEFLEKTEEEFLEDPTLIEDQGIDEFLEDLEDTETAEFLEDHTLIKDQRIEKSLQYQTLIEEILEDSTLIEDQGTEEFLEDYTLIEDQGIEKSLEDQILIEDQGTEEFLEGYTLIEDQGIEEFMEDYTLIEDQGIEESLEDQTLIEDQGIEEFLEDYTLIEDQGTEKSLEDQTLIEKQGTKESSSEYPRIDTFFFIPEEVHILPKSSLIRVENNSIIGVGTWLTLSKRSRVGGLVQVERTKKYIELRIFSGDIHFFEETDDISRDSDILISKEENNSKESHKSKDWICVQGITPIKKIKEKYFFSIRPVVTYELPDRMDMKLATLFSQDLLQERENLQLRVIHYWLYGSSKPIRIISLKSIQLVRTCLVLNWDQEKNSFIEEEVHASFVEVRTNDLIRDFIKMELIKSPISYTRKRYDRASLGWILDNRLNATNINPFYSKIKIQAFHQHKGRIVGTLLNPNKIYKSLIILSSSNCFQMDPNTVTKKRNPLFLYGYSVGPLGTIVPKIANFYSFYHLITHNEILLKKYLLLYNLKDTFLLFQLMKICLLDIGNLNLNSCFILKPSLFRKTLQVFKVQILQFYLIDRNKRSYLKYISKKVFQVLEVSKYCLIDENSKIYNPESCGGFILNPFNWNWCPFFHNDNCEETSTIIRLGQFLCENVCLFKDKSYVQKSGQIIIVNLDSLVIRSAKPYLVTSGATVHGDYGKILYEGDTLVTFLYEKSRSSDITQGLPKVEQMFEVRSIDSISTNLRSRIEGWNEHIPGIIGVPWSFLIGAELTIAQSRISLVNKIQKVYRSQGVQIHNRHIEMIVRQVTSRVLVSEDGMSNIFLPRELVGLLRAERVGRALDESIFYRAILLGITKASLNTQSFISEASFQETARVLAKAAVRGRIDWLKGLKENVVLGRLLPIGTGFQFKGFLRPLGQDKNLEEKKNIYIFKPEMRDIMLHHKEFICSDVTHNLDEAHSYEI